MSDADHDANTITFKTVKSQMAAGMHIEPRIRPRESNGRIASSTPDQKKLSSMVASVKYNKKKTNPGITKSMKSNVFAALGMKPAGAKSAGDKADGKTMDELLTSLIEQVVMPDGTRFKVDKDNGFGIVKVKGTNRFACIVKADLFCVV